MIKIDSFYVYIAVRKAIEDVLSREGYDVTKCFNILEPGLGIAFTRIKQIESELMSHGEVVKKVDDRQTSFITHSGEGIKANYN